MALEGSEREKSQTYISSDLSFEKILKDQLIFPDMSTGYSFMYLQDIHFIARLILFKLHLAEKGKCISLLYLFTSDVNTFARNFCPRVITVL